MTLLRDGYWPVENQWIAQWNRIERWFTRLSKLKNKKLKSDLSNQDLDEILAYFQNVFALRDWLLESRPNLKDKINLLFRGHIELKACRDIANGYKHKVVKNPSLDPDFEILRTFNYDEYESSHSKNPTKYVFSFALGRKQQDYELFHLAEESHRILNTFVQSMKTSAANKSLQPTAANGRRG